MAISAGPIGSAPISGHFEALFDVAEPAGERSIIQVASLVNEGLVNHLYNNPEGLRDIDRRLFEELVAELFSGFGYDVELTRRTRDGGKDIVAVKNREVAVKFLIECKRPEPGNPVRVSAVRELHSVKVSEGATKAILATTTHFTRDAKLFFEKHRWELEPKDFDAIRQWMSTYLHGKRQQ